ncbi:MAG: repressor LexA [Clostridia bacterium]|nr:repressor LexA [Clostridia bacterium]
MPKHLDRDETREKISRFIEDYYTKNDKKPAIRDIAAGTGISVSSVFRILHEMEDDGTVKVEIKKQRSIVTKRMETEGPHVSIPVLGTVACGPGEEEEEHLTEYIRMPESLVGKGELFALIAKGESMIDAGIYPGDLVIVRRDKKAEIGDIVVALLAGMNNLKVLGFDNKLHRYLLKSCNNNRKAYPDIPVEAELRIQGVAVCVSHRLGKVDLS